MLTGVLLSLGLAIGAVCSDLPTDPRGDESAGHPPLPSVAMAATAADDRLAELYREGKSFAEFLEGARSRREQWHRIHERARVPDEIAMRVRAVPGRWHILVVAEDGCSDSVNSIPYLARLVEVAPALEMRIIGSRAGKSVTQAHRTPDDRAATPTVVLLTEGFDEAGCWIERPAELRRWVTENRDRLGDDFGREKQAWYDRDGGAQVLRELTEMIEGAAAGKTVCG
jgi:hypothetical protein